MAFCELLLARILARRMRDDIGGKVDLDNTMARISNYLGIT